jgi:A/G-specific adenine glycosylase
MGESGIRGLPAVRRALLAWHREQGMHAPWRESGDPYEALVAAVMAQQTQMSRVTPSYERFMAAFPTIESLAQASLGDVIRVWAGMGYNQRAVRLHRAARRIAAGGWPREAEALATIDGIGPFTAAIVASFAFGEPAACVDTNVRRVLGRLAGDEQIDGRPLQRLADAVLAADQPARWNQALMDYGARVCVRRPRCDECVVSRWCASRERYAGDGTPLSMVADERAPFGRPKRPRPPAEKFEDSDRYYRGRIIDVLRGLAPGEMIPLDELAARISNGGLRRDAASVRALVEALQSQGLAVFRGDRVALPE